MQQGPVNVNVMTKIVTLCCSILKKNNSVQCIIQIHTITGA